jgi:hypothetical protein
MQYVIVTLAHYEVRQAVEVAARRQLSMWNRQQRPLHGVETRGNNWQYQIVGAIGELAVAKFFGSYWETPTLDDVDRLPADAGAYEVRATEHDPAHLYVHDYDTDDRPFVLAVVKRNRIKLAGWAWKADVETCGQWEKSPTHPTWRLHQDRLRPISDLITHHTTWKA